MLAGTGLKLVGRRIPATTIDPALTSLISPVSRLESEILEMVLATRLLVLAVRRSSVRIISMNSPTARSLKLSLSVGDEVSLTVSLAQQSSWHI